MRGRRWDVLEGVDGCSGGFKQRLPTRVPAVGQVFWGATSIGYQTADGPLGADRSGSNPRSRHPGSGLGCSPLRWRIAQSPHQ